MIRLHTVSLRCKLSFRRAASGNESRPHIVTTQHSAIRRLIPLDAGTRLDDLLSAPYGYRGWEDIYRQKWTWDKVVKVTHHRANCGSTCSLNAYVKDGIVWREEQNANYAQTREDVPDYNPRGCPMGCVYSIEMYDPSRIKYPMKRVGERGEGKWERLSWDQALEEIADKLLDVIEEDGSECIIFDDGTSNVDFGIGSGMESKVFGSGLGSTTIDNWGGVGDLPSGLIQSWGVVMSNGTGDDMFLSDYIMIWIANPSYTKVTDVHFMHEARYRGAKIVTIAPDFSASTVHADRWLNVRYGTDAALALGMVHVILEEKLHKPEFIKEQTDLPFLVRDDNHRFLRESDLEEDGADDVFYYWNATTGRRTKATGTWGSDVASIALDEGHDPALEGAHAVKLLDGNRVRVRPVFELLRERVAEYTPERVAEITGVAAGNIRRVAREYAGAKSAMIYSSWGAVDHYHSDLFQRGMTYLCGLTGHSGGRPGSGLKNGSWWPAPSAALGGGPIPGGGGLRMTTEPPDPTEPPPVRLGAQELAKMVYPLARKGGTRAPLLPWLYAHDPAWRETADRTEYADPALTRPMSEYMQEIFGQGWQSVSPQPPKRPRFLYFSGVNPLRRWPRAKVIRDSLWKSFETIVTCDFRMSWSGMWSDYILPACGYYEKPGIKYTETWLPYVNVGDRAVQPLYDSKHEWDIGFLMAKKIQERAIARGMESFTDSQGREHPLSTMYDEMTADSPYREGEAGEVAALDFIMQHSAITRASNLGENAWSKAADVGLIKIEAVDPAATTMSHYSDYEPDQPMNQMDYFIHGKEPWPTLTGRQQFYIDHEWFLEVGEELVVHKEPPQAGGPYPLWLTGGHTRWSTHSIARTVTPLLRLQRGEPVVYISEADARERGIADHDRVRVFNDVGEFTLRAKVSPSGQPGMILVYHAWEGHQFPGGAVQNDVSATAFKPLSMVGGYGQLQHPLYSQNHYTKGNAVDVEKVESAP